MSVRDAHDRLTTIQSVLYALAVAGLLILSSISMFYALNLPSEVTFTESSMTCTFYFSEPQLREIVVDDRLFTQLSMEHCVSQAAVGDPMLPVFPAYLLLPEGGEVSDIKVTYRESIPLEYDFTNKPIMPQQELVPFSVDAGDTPFIINETLYTSSPRVFDHLFKEGEIGFCRGFAILTVYLFPVQYLPKDGIVYYFPEMKITVTFTQNMDAPVGENASLLRYSERDKELIESIVANPTMIETYAPSGGGDGYLPLSTGGLCGPSDNHGLGYQYVVLTNADLKDTNGYSYNWSDLIDHRKNTSGLEATIVTVEEITACPEYWNETSVFNDSQAHIREFCKDAYLDWGTEYLLIGGDWDSTPSHQIVPYRVFTDHYETLTYDTMACDLYYSHLDGDWYDVPDEIWGGGRLSGVNDYYGEISVGRLAVSTAADVSNAIQKIIWYDTNATGSWLTKAAFWGGDLGWTATSKQYMEELRFGNDTYRTFTGFEEWNTANPNETLDTHEHLYHADLGDDYITYFSDSVEDDNASMINHIDHSDWEHPFGMDGWDTRVNTKPFFGFSQGCLAGRYESGDAGCEQLISASPQCHAYALVLNTGYGYGSTVTTNGPGQYLQAYFWDYFFTNQSTNMSHWQLGKAFQYSQDSLGAIVDSQPSHAWCYNWYSTHFFGDPAQTLRIHTPNQPVILSNETPLNGSTGISINLSSLSVTLEDPEEENISWSIQTVPAVGSNSSLVDSNGVKSCMVSGLEYETIYIWYVNVTDGEEWTNTTYSFTTEADPRNNSPRFTDLSLSNETHGVSVHTAVLSLMIQDPEGDPFNWTIETHPFVGSNAGTEEYNGTKSCVLSDVQVGTTYTWAVNATDTGNGTQTSAWYTFTTTAPPVLSNLSPADAATNVSIGTAMLSLTLEDSEGDTMNYSIQTAPAIGNSTVNGVQNGTASCTITGLNYSTTYTWCVNVTDSEGWTNDSFSFTTESVPVNDSPVFLSVSPGNGSTDVLISTSSVSLLIQDPEGDFFNWSMTTSPNIGSTNGVNASNGSKSCSLSGLAYSTTYHWYVSSMDQGSGNWTNGSYWFTTEDTPQGGYSPGGHDDEPVEDSQNHRPNQPTQASGPTLVELGVRYNYTSTASDPDDDQVRLRFAWGDGTLSNWTAHVASNTSVSLPRIWQGLSTYDLRVVAQDENETLSNWSVPLQVTVLQELSEEPVPEITAPENVSANETILFDASGSFDPDGVIVSYFWEFGDGTTGVGATPVHAYVHPGQYMVTLTLTDKNGNTYQKHLVVTVGSAAETIGSDTTFFVLLAIAFFVIVVFGGVCLHLLRRRIPKRSHGQRDALIKQLSKKLEELTQFLDNHPQTKQYTFHKEHIASSSDEPTIEKKIDTVILGKIEEKIDEM